MSQIFVEPTELREAERLMGKSINTIRNIQQTIRSIDNNTTSFWQGRASARNHENSQDLREMTNRFLVRAMNTRAALQRALIQYERIENSQTQRVGNLNTKNLFQ